MISIEIQNIWDTYKQTKQNKKKVRKQDKIRHSETVKGIRNK